MRLERRVVLAGFAGVLLALPLILLLGHLLRPATAAGGRQRSPVLDTEARTRLGTYRRDCGPDRACEAPLGCVWDTRIPARYCSDSQCTTEMHCPEGQVCRDIASEGGGPLVGFCVPAGSRQEGERCLALTLDKNAACAADLICGGQEGWCARPCHKDRANACPEGFFCANTIPEPVCLPTCKMRGCPTGQHCIQDNQGASQCVVVHGADCQQTPCSAGSACQVRYDRAKPGHMWMECIQPCGGGSPPCPTGMSCDGWACRPSCDPQTHAACGEGYRCAQADSDTPYTCQPDL